VKSIRDVVGIWLREGARERLRRQITAYAAQVAESRDDLDVDLERAGLESWS